MSFSFHLARYKWLRDYYRHARLDVSLKGCAFRDGQGTTFGYLDEVRFKEGRLHLRGWTLAEHVSLRLGSTQILRRPQEEREDVAQALGCDRHVGFRASMPFENTQLLIELERDGQTVSILHDMQIERSLTRAERRLNLAFLRDVLPQMPMIVMGLLRRDPDLPRRIKAALKLGHSTVEAMLDAAFLVPSDSHETPRVPASQTQAPELSVILPVYDAFELLPETLQRLCDHTDLPCHLIVIEDCSPDPRVRPLLRDWVSRAQGQLRISLLENETNLGFIGSVNRGFSCAQESGCTGPVILLNSDAMVPAGWTSRLIAPLANPDVASATPLSNDAEIFGAPVLCSPTPLAPGQGDCIDAGLRQAVATDAPEVTAPTGVGFCMALNYSWLQRLGGFDAMFGRGYGEEVDWCRRAVAQGGRHLAVPNLFVEHRGGASFGAEKLALVQQNNAIISLRYPGYDQLVQDFIRLDPLVTPRLMAALLWADSLPEIAEIPVFIAHSMGGGAEYYLQDRVQAAHVSVVLRFGGNFRCRVELDSPQGRVIANTDDMGMVARMLERVSKRRILYSCAVGDPDLSEVPEFLLQLARTAPLELLFHDYLPLSPSYTLLDADGVYRGVPSLDHSDRAHCYRCGDGNVLSLRDWRTLWGQATGTAERLVVFSEASAQIVAEAFPRDRGKIEVIAHKMLQVIPPLPRPEGPRKVLGVLGAIGPQKGAAVVSALALAVEAESNISLALIGRIAPGFPLGDQVAVHGTYAIEDIPALAARYGITHWLIPSIWPETFSYTVHECLATGLPTLAFALGAQGDAVRVAENGVILPWETGRTQPEQLAARVLQALT